MASKNFKFKIVRALGSPERLQVILGESAVGKSSILNRYVQNQFSDYQDTTIGSAYRSKTIDIEGDQVTLEIWDTAGQERYHSLAPMYYKGAKGIIVVFDITNKTTFERAKNWVTELEDNAPPDAEVILAANKCDMEGDREVGAEEINAFCVEYGMQWMETSRIPRAKQSVLDHQPIDLAPQPQSSCNC